jgi:hypothetical protein
VTEGIDAMNEAVAKTDASRESVLPSGPPLVAAGLVATYRASMVERDLWDHVLVWLRQHGETEFLQTLDTLHPNEWVELERFVSLIDAIGATIGVNELRSMVRKRIVDPSGSSFYAPMLRSWARSFGASAGHMLRGAVHVWRAALRNAGGLRAVDVLPGEVHLVIEGPAAAAYRGSQALSATLEGLALGVLDLAQPRPVFVEVELSPRREPTSLVCRFRG